MDTASWADRLIATGEYRTTKEGLRGIAYSCSNIPEELLSVPGLCGVRLRAPNTTTTETADRYLGLIDCSCSRAMLKAILRMPSGTTPKGLSDAVFNSRGTELVLAGQIHKMGFSDYEAEGITQFQVGSPRIISMYTIRSVCSINSKYDSFDKRESTP